MESKESELRNCPKSNHPKVLLVGNGLNLAYGGVSWTNLLKQIARPGDLPLNELQSPMPLQAILMTNNNIKEAEGNGESWIL